MTLSDDIKLIARRCVTPLKWLAFGLLPSIYLLSGFYSLEGEQAGVLKQFGRIVNNSVEPGMHYHLPWPIQSVDKLSVAEIRSMEMDFSEEVDRLLQPESTTGTGDLVDVALSVQYNISDAGRYLSQAQSAENMLRHIVASETLFYLGGNDIDQLLTTGRNRLQTAVRSSVQSRLAELELGVRVTSIQLQRLDPPPSIKRAFDAVDSARSERQKLIQDAEGERNAKLAQARGAARVVMAQAEAEASEYVQLALGDTSKLLASLEQFEKTPKLTRSAIYYETLERIFSKAKLQIVSPTEE